MPKLSEFFGIAIYMHWREHGPSHFHVVYAGEVARSLEPLSAIDPLR